MKHIIKMEHCGIYRIELSDGTLGFFARASELTKYTGIKYPFAQPGWWVLDVEQHPPVYFQNHYQGRGYIARVYRI